MDIFDFAMQMEKDGQAYYEKLADQSENSVLRQILLNLALDEVKHYNIFKRFKEGDMSASKEMETVGTKVIENAKNIFQEMSKEPFPGAFSADVRAAWVEAQKIEKKSEDFYREKAGEVETESMKNTILKIADEEHRHWVLIDNVLQFLDRPRQWLEDAEWNHLEPY
jgi:rubrerythrin